MPHIEIAAEHLFSLGGFPITNALLASLLTVLVVAGGIAFLGRVKIIPAGFQNLIEVAVEALMGLLESVVGSREKAEQYFPLIGAIFLFILVSNWLGVFPGIGSLLFIERATHQPIPLFRSAASDLNFTLALGIIAVGAINAWGARVVGFGPHLKKFFTVKSPIDFFIGILEFISEFAKIISFSFRLFGNVFAGEVLLAVIAFVASVLTPPALTTFQPLAMAFALFPFLGIEIFVGFIQALVFAMLTSVFVSIATAHH